MSESVRRSHCQVGEIRPDGFGPELVRGVGVSYTESGNTTPAVRRGKTLVSSDGLLHFFQEGFYRMSCVHSLTTKTMAGTPSGKQGREMANWLLRCIRQGLALYPLVSQDCFHLRVSNSGKTSLLFSGMGHLAHATGLSHIQVLEKLKNTRRNQSQPYELRMIAGILAVIST